MELRRTSPLILPMKPTVHRALSYHWVVRSVKLSVLVLVRARLPSCLSCVPLRSARAVVGRGIGLVGGLSGGAGWFEAARHIKWQSGRLE